jgi:DDE superfamily endonuclease
VRRKLFTTDPNRRVILHRLRTWWHHRPRGALLAYFDVQPITVKAYGGRRYTTAKRLVLQRNQKTRGRFYLFLLYEVNHGRVHWAFFPGKGAKYVCQFLRRVRRWYPRVSVRIALDRDPAHPIKAKVTRSVMRQLHLNWTSLPKRSPDDNPDETIFSDIQQQILDNSDDPDQRTTQRRISSHLQGRNRRSDRFIRIPYLEHPRRDSHKN